MAVGGFPEKIVSAFHCVHDECSNEEHIMGKCNVAVHSVERMLKEVENISSQGMSISLGYICLRWITVWVNFASFLDDR